MAVAFSGTGGTILGLVSGYFGGTVDMVIMRIVDILMAFPGMLLAIAIVAARGTGLFNTVVAISVVGVSGYARLVRSMVLSLREREYIQAAHMVGVRDPRIIFRHILPNALSPIIVNATLVIGAANPDSAGLVSGYWMVLAYLLHTTGELCLSPVGLSMVTKLSPAKLVSTTMGAWFLATALSNYLAAIIASFRRSAAVPWMRALIAIRLAFSRRL